MDHPVSRTHTRGTLNTIHLADAGQPVPLAELEEALLTAEEDFDATSTVTGHPHQPYLITRGGALLLEYLTRTPDAAVLGAKPFVVHQFGGQPVPEVKPAPNPDEVLTTLTGELAQRYGIHITPPRTGEPPSGGGELPADTDELLLKKANSLRERGGNAIERHQNAMDAARRESRVTPTGIARRDRTDPRYPHSPRIVVGGTKGNRAPTLSELHDLTRRHRVVPSGWSVPLIHKEVLVQWLLEHFDDGECTIDHDNPGKDDA